MSSRINPGARHLATLAALAVLAIAPSAAHAASLHVVFPQTAEATVVQGQSTVFTLEVDALGAVPCSATTAPVVVETLYSVDAIGDIAAGSPADMPIETAANRGSSDNCYIKTPVTVSLTATAAAATPVGDYTSVVRYGHGGDGDVDLDGPALTIHVIAPNAQPVVLPPPALAPPEIIVLGEREAPKPKLGQSVQLTLVKGEVTYREPGKASHNLTSSVIVVNGTVVDATDGVVKVTVVHDSSGGLDSVDAWGGGFGVVQSLPRGQRPLTTLTLRGRIASTQGASAARASKKSKFLWVNGKGNFKTKAKRASATVRGTYWLTRETASGTKVQVKRGLVAVRDFVRKRTVLVSQGHQYVARPRTHQARRIPAFTGSA